MPIVLSEVNHRSNSKRLPCRGCTDDCPNYATCDGKPWRPRQSAPVADRTSADSASQSGEPRN